MCKQGPINKAGVMTWEQLVLAKLIYIDLGVDSTLETDCIAMCMFVCLKARGDLCSTKVHFVNSQISNVPSSAARLVHHLTVNPVNRGDKQLAQMHSTVQ